MYRRGFYYFILLLALLVMGCAHRPSPPPPPQGGTEPPKPAPLAYQAFSSPRVIYVNRSMVNIRAEADKGSKILGVVRQRKTLTAIGEKGSWYYIQLGRGKQGWVSTAVTTMVEPGEKQRESELNPPDTAEQPHGAIKVRDKWALVIGIARFRDSRIRPLKYSDDDAEAMYRFLIDPNLGRFKSENVIKLINEQATTKEIKKVIDTIAKNSQTDDLVLVYVSTHGTPGRYDIADVGYLVTHDTEVNSLYATAYEMADLTKALTKRIKAHHVVAFMDTCYSAGSFQEEPLLIMAEAKDIALEGMGVSEELVEKMSQSLGRVLISSSRQDERSWESDDLKHGYFTYYLLDALKREKGYVTLDEVYRHLKKRVPVNVKKEKNKSQHPMMGSSLTGGNISIGILPSIPD